MLCTKGHGFSRAIQESNDEGFSLALAPEVRFLSFLALSRLEAAAKSRTSVAKAIHSCEIYGTAEAVPLRTNHISAPCLGRISIQQNDFDFRP
jgi:hypothetical protein